MTDETPSPFEDIFAEHFARKSRKQERHRKYELFRTALVNDWPGRINPMLETLNADLKEKNFSLCIVPAGKRMVPDDGSDPFIEYSAAKPPNVAFPYPVDFPKLRFSLARALVICASVEDKHGSEMEVPISEQGFAREAVLGVIKAYLRNCLLLIEPEE